MTVLVFGCFGKLGHHKQGPGWDSLPPAESIRLKQWADYTPDIRDSRRPENQPEGRSWLRRHAGWTAFGWYDRHGPDTRNNSHTTLLARGDWTADEMLAAAPAWAVRVTVILPGAEGP